MLDSLQCRPRLFPDHKSEYLVSKEQENVLLMAGGEEEGKLVRKVDIFPSSNYSSCLPNLPKPLKWGSLGLLGETLLLCGGQNGAEQPTQACWALDKEKKESAQWKPHNNLTRCIL